MRIKSVHIQPLKAKLLMPFRVATGQHDSVDNVLLTLTLANGLKGYGEAAVASHITGETIAQTINTLQGFSKHLHGKNIGEYLSIAAFANEYVGHNKCALAAIEMALFDAVTRYLNIPLWKVWGQKPKRLVSDITLVIGSLEETKQTAHQFYRQGFRAFKIKIGRDIDLDFQRVCAVHAIVGQSSIVLDANQGYDAKQALKFLFMMGKAGINIAMIEQPVAKNDIEGLIKITHGSKVLVCADESASSLNDAVDLIKHKRVGAINIKLMKTGIVHAVHIARLAQAHGIKLMVGGMMETSLAMTASAHLAAGLGGFDFIDLDTPFLIKDGLKNNPYLSRRGEYDLSAVSAGIGIHP